MSDKITKTVVYEINPDGNCGKCWSGLKEHCPNPLSDDFQYFCMPFQTMLKSELKTYGMFSNRNYQQCQACRDYLEAEKTKVKCDNCKYFIYDWMESECTKGNENTCGETFARDDWFCVNCQDRSE